MGDNGHIRFLEPAEVQAILEAPSLRSLTGLRNRCIMGIMYEAGLRISEALALKPRDVSLEDKRVEVLRGKGHLIVYFFQGTASRGTFAMNFDMSLRP